MKSGSTTVALALAALVAAMPARAGDPWEGGYHSDDSSQSGNTLGAGSVQQHDLAEDPAGVDDQDWVMVPTLAGHSYEVRLN
ncbi:MAG: hypothetical protein ABW221_14125, partial [Vicinamibacteria bacterium]